jgi:Zn-dependent protease
MDNTYIWILIGLPVFLVSGSFHEYMHAWTAKKLGDYTATSAGRLTLNPLAHIDPWGLVMMLVARFGWMRPVPLNEYNFRKPTRDTAIVALAGPLSNLALALVASIIFKIFSFDSVTLSLSGSAALSGFMATVLYIFIYTNSALAVFNLLPVPPLDGFRIIRAIIPESVRHIWESLENYSLLIMIALFLPFSPFSPLLYGWIGGGIGFVLGILL